MGNNAFDTGLEAGEIGTSVSNESRSDVALFVIADLAVGDSGVIVDHRVHDLIADLRLAVWVLEVAARPRARQPPPHADLQPVTRLTPRRHLYKKRCAQDLAFQCASFRVLKSNTAAPTQNVAVIGAVATCCARRNNARR